MNNPSSSVVVSFSESLIEQADFTAIEAYYNNDKLVAILAQVLAYLAQHPKMALPDHLSAVVFDKPTEVEIYVTEPIEAQAINLEARGKDYATNILSYPSDLPESVLALLPTLPLGELVICHAVVATQAAEQGKTVADHLTHLLVHGVLHLLGFDHELGEADQQAMESIEIAVLATLGVANPYE